MVALEQADPDRVVRIVHGFARHRDTIESWSLIAHVEALVELLRGNAELARGNRSAAERQLSKLPRGYATDVGRGRGRVTLAAGDSTVSPPTLSKRELVVAREFAQGYIRAEIAERLICCHRTR